jgi:hypothetical protein
MKSDHIQNAKFSIILLAGILLASCGLIEGGFEDTPNAPSNNSTDAEQDSPPVTTEAVDLQPDDPELSLPSLVHNPQAPEMVSIGRLAPAAGTDIGVVIREENQITLEASPVEYGLFWGYTPVTGRLAYSSEFWGPSSDGSNISVSDLWVYDYATGQSEQWLPANVSYARWAPDGMHLAAAVWNPQAQWFDMMLVSGPDQTRVVAECGSMQFEWHPYSNQLAYANLLDWAGVRPECKGSYIITFSEGLEAGTVEIEQVSTFGAEDQLNGSLNDRPVWALGHDALIILDSPFWVVPMDGSPAFVPSMPEGEDPLGMPRLVDPLWVPQQRQLVGFVETGMMVSGGVFIYQFSEDLSAITEVLRIETQPLDENTDLMLMGWWEPGKSLLLLDHNMALETEFLSEYWGMPVIWSLTERTFIPLP